MYAQSKDRALGRWAMCVLRDQQGASVVSAQGVWEEGKEMSSERSAGIEVGRCCGT